MFERIYQQHWIDLPKDTRLKLAEVFGIERTGPTEVRDQTVISDGYSNSDLSAITLEKMNAYVGSDETFSRAWELTLAKVKFELNPPVVVVGKQIENRLEGEINEEESKNEITKKKLK